MVRIGISESWGSEIRNSLGTSLDNRFKAFFTGLGVTMLLQSSSATALLTASFSGQGMLTTATALAILLGADVGTTLVAQILTFDFSALSPILIALGVALFTYSEGGRRRDIGRLLLGLGLMLLSLQLIVQASLPMRESLIIQQIFVALGEDLVLAVIFAALIAWAAHSSLATVLLVITLASANVLDGTVAFAFVLGANIGSAIPPFIATLGANRSARQPPLGNLLFRVCGVVIVLPFVGQIASQLSSLDMSNARQIADNIARLSLDAGTYELNGAGAGAEKFSANRIAGTLKSINIGLKGAGPQAGTASGLRAVADNKVKQFVEGLYHQLDVTIDKIDIENPGSASEAATKKTLESSMKDLAAYLQSGGGGAAAPDAGGPTGSPIDFPEQ